MTMIYNGKLPPAVIEFLKLFIKPYLLRQKNNGEPLNLHAALEEFLILDRKVISATVIKDFRMPGQLLVAGDKVLPGTKKIIKAGSKLLVSVDKKINTCNIELETNEVYRVTYKRFQAIVKYLDKFGESGFEDNYQHRSTRFRDSVHSKLRK